MFDKEIRARLVSPYPVRFYNNDNNEEAKEKGVLTLLDLAQESSPYLLDEGSWPNFLTLQCSLNAIPLHQGDASVALSIGGQQLSPQPFYSLDTLFSSSCEKGEASQIKHILIEYEGVGIVTHKHKTKPFRGQNLDTFTLELEPEQALFQREFITQQGALHQYEIFEGSSWVTIPPKGRAGEHLFPLIAYGGYFKLGAELKEIEPVFALVKQGEEHSTALQLLSASELRHMQITPLRCINAEGEEWIFCEALQERDLRSMAGTLLAGEVRIKLYDHDHSDSLWYRSVSYDHPDPYVPHLTITFKSE